MKLEISIENIQNIKRANFVFNLVENSLICITGKNGSGKTTLMKSVKNLISADTFFKTSSSRSFSEGSNISYKLDDKEIQFKYDKTKKMMDSTDIVPNEIRKQISIELPIPHGDRFSFFDKISENDFAIRTQVVVRRYSKPLELIDFLESVYLTKRFENLVELRIRNVPYYVIIAENNYYLREDYFSSGEYFLISIYRKIISGFAAIFIDEIDISLDAAAQVRLIEWLRRFNQIYHTTFVFTTHSLAMMKTLAPDELHYMQIQEDGATTIEKKSYSFIKRALFGFASWDKYILTEDEVLSEFLEYFIAKYLSVRFYQHKIIYIGGSSNTTGLMERNKTEKFFSEDADNVIVVLDGDQKKLRHSKNKNVYCIPMESIEKELLTRCLKGEFWVSSEFEKLIDDHARLRAFINSQPTSNVSNLKALYYKIVLIFKKNPTIRRALSDAQGVPAKEKDFKKAGKKLFNFLVSQKIYSNQEIFEFLIEKNFAEIQELRTTISDFVSL